MSEAGSEEHDSVDWSGERTWLQEPAHHAQPGLSTHVEGGRVDRLLNIGKASVVQIEQPAGRSTAVTQLPPDIIDFIGRTEILEKVQELYNSSTAKSQAIVISAVAGKAGVGKTALAVHLAHEMRTNYPDGQLYVNLRGAEAETLDPSKVLAEFLRALGVENADIPDELEQRARYYRARLSDRRVLVLLDNAANETQVRPLLPANPSCAVLITSRSRLAGLEGAQTFNLEVLGVDQAVDLLRKIAGQERVAAEPGAAEAIVRLCGYLPLAVRIAGARLAAKPHWSLEKLANRLMDERTRLDELRIGDLHVRPALALSYRGQVDDQQRLFRQLSLINASSFPAWIASSILDADLATAEDAVEQLVDAQLIEVAIDKDGTGGTRYRFHDLLRDFARERVRLEDSPSTQRRALGGILSCYLALAEHAAGRILRDLPQISHSDGYKKAPPAFPSALVDMAEKNAIDWFMAERGNLTMSVLQASDAGFWDVAWRLARSLDWFFRVRAHWDDWQRTQEIALDAALQMRDRHAQALTLSTLGKIYWAQGRWNDAAVCFHRCIPTLQEFGDRHEEAIVRRQLGAVYRDQGRWNDAIACFKQCLPVLREFGDRHEEAVALRNLGKTYWAMGRWRDAIDCFSNCLEVFRSFSSHHEEAVTLRNIAIVYRDQGRFDEAISYCKTCLSVFRELGDHRWEAYTIADIGVLHRDRGHFEESLRYFRHCLPVFQELGDRRWEAITVRNIGILFGDQGRFDEALGCFLECLPVFRELGDRHWAAYTVADIAAVYRGQGRFDEALECLRQCLPVFQEFGARHWEAKTLSLLGEVMASKGDRVAAEAAWRDALQIFRDIGAPEAAQIETLLDA